MMHKLSFEVVGTVGITYKDLKHVEVQIDGVLLTSGCQAQALIKTIEIKDIPMLLGHDELLDQFSSTDILDYVCNNHTIDLDWFIKELTKAGV
jgi:hypothetical protein